jgi:hypothetical protein
MKKIIVFSFLLASMSVCGLYAQKGTTPKSNESGTVSEQGTGSAAKAKGVGKGTPLVQRQSGGAAGAPAPAEGAAEKSAVRPIPDSLKPKSGEMAKPATGSKE